MLKFKKQIILILVIIILAPTLFLSAPKKADATIPVADWLNTAFHAITSATGLANHTKTWIFDTLATNVAKIIIKQLAAQTVNWINSGFKGNPAYVTNTGQFFQNVADTEAAQFLSSNSVLASLCSPFQAKIRLALAKNYLNPNQNFSCTLGKLEQNFDNFTNNFSQGGWDGWFQMTQNTSNNPYGAYIEGQDQLSINIGNSQAKYQQQLSWGQGFLSWQTCKPGAAPIASSGGVQGGCTGYNSSSVTDITALNTASGCQEAGGTWSQAANNATDQYVSSNDGLNCSEADKQTNTPGSVIGAKLNGVLGSDVLQLAVVQGINQIVGALITQLTQQVVGGIGSGLRGLSQSTPNSGVQSIVTQLSSNPNDPTTPNGQENTTVTNTVQQESQTKPTLTLLGDSVMYVQVGTTFVDPGATAVDITDGDISSKVAIDGGPVDTTTDGTYVLTYSVENSQNLYSDPVTRTVYVNDTGLAPNTTSATGGQTLTPTS